MLTGLLLVKISIIAISIIALAFFLFKRYRSKDKANLKLKHNVQLLRTEKLLAHSDKKLEKKRQHLIKKIKVSDEGNQKKIIQKAKRMGLPAGEILLAIKIHMSTK